MKVFILITNKCNISCNMCIRGRQYEFADMDYDYAKILFKNNFVEPDEIVVTGGEPTIHSRFLDFIGFLSPLADTVNVTTNGIENRYVHKLASIHNVFIQLSLDGIEKVHDARRGKGVFKKVLNTIEVLNKYNIPFSISSAIGRDNVKQLDLFIEFLNGLNCFKYWRPTYLMPYSNADISDMLDINLWNAVVDNIIKDARFYVKVKKIFDFDNIDNKKYNSSQMILNCGCVRNKIYIYPDFDVFPCTCLTSFKLGNLQNERLEELLNSKVAKEFKSYKILGESYCSTCEYKNICNGGCIGMSLLYFKRIGMGDIRCPHIRENYER